MVATPNSRPKITREEVEKILKLKGVTDKVCLLGIRGYYLDSMGVKGKNDRAVYDDALIWITPDVFATFNANCDPGAYRKGIANLKTGVWRYKPGPHPYKQPNYPAFRQAGDVVVHRDGLGDDKGDFGINIHRGGLYSVSSLGCQTLPRAQWEAFQKLGYSELKRHGQANFPYILMTEEERRTL